MYHGTAFSHQKVLQCYAKKDDWVTKGYSTCTMTLNANPLSLLTVVPSLDFPAPKYYTGDLY